MKKRKMMIVGAGRDQTPIIKKAREMGFETIVISVAGDYPGLQVADKSYDIDTRQKEAILEIARSEGICGIVSDQLDAAVPTVAYVAERLGLAGIGYDCALKFTNKYAMRQLCKEIGAPVLKHFQASSLDQALLSAKHIKFPLIIKPVDSGGSRGVTKVSSLGELEDRFQNTLNYSVSGKVLLEEYFPASEIVVEGFVSDYEVTHLTTADRYYFALPNMFVPSRTLFPSLLDPNLKNRIIELDRRMMRHSGLKFGVTHSEYLFDRETEEVRLVETAARGGGVLISSDLIPLACGINVTELLIELASGKAGVRADHSKRVDTASGYVCFYLPEGIIREVKGLDEVEALPGVCKAYLQSIKVGEQTKPMTHKGSRLGPILINGKDRQALQDVISRLRETLRIKVETKDGYRGIVW
jgi:biotin carboxylase